MSDTHHQPGVLTTEEAAKGINVKLIVAVGAISLVVFGLSAVVAGLILSADEAAIAAGGPPNETKLMGQREIGIVDFVQFSEDTRLPEWKAEVARKLQGYSWVDRVAGRVRLPIAEGMKKAMAEAAAGTAVGAANAEVAHEPDVPRLMKAAVETAESPASSKAPLGGSPATPLVPAAKPGAAGEKDPRPPGGNITP